MTITRKATGVTFALGALIATDMLIPSASILGAAPAHAVVGRPLTPVSVAGVARRTTRRTVVATSAVAAPPPTTTTVVVQAPPPAAPPPAAPPATAPPPQPPQR